MNRREEANSACFCTCLAYHMKIVNSDFHHKKHFKTQLKSKKTVYLTLILTFLFAILELTGGLISNSLSLIGDSFHMFSDVLALGSSVVAIYFSSKKPDDRFTFGYLRLEAIVAFLNGLALMIISGGILIEGIGRIFKPIEIELATMFGISLTGLLFNIVITYILYQSMKSEKNLNVKSALLHFLGDLLNSVGVIISGVLIYFTGYAAVDIIMSFIIAVIIFIGGFKISKEAFMILMEAVPKSIDIQTLRNDLLQIEGIENIHELHVWKTDSEEISLMAHILLSNYDKFNNYRIINEVNARISKYDIFHSTIQIENTDINVHEGEMDKKLYNEDYF